MAKFTKYGVKYVRNPQNLGVPENYNLALGMASSDYVMIFGDHDVMHETFIERCADRLDADPDVVLAFPVAKAIDESGNVIREYRRDLFPSIFPGQLLARWLVTHVAAPLTLDTLIRRSALQGLEPWFDPKYWWYGDIYLWIRLAAKGKVGYVSEPVLYRRVREEGHPLDNQQWRSNLVLHHIRRGAWELAFPDGGSASWWARLVYACRRDIKGFLLILSRLARSPSDRSEVLPEEALDFFSPVGRMIAPLLASLPPGLAQGLRCMRHRYLPSS